jgi:hypothetical protein
LSETAAETAAVGPTSIGIIDEDPNINWSDLESIVHFVDSETPSAVGPAMQLS